MKSSLFSSMNIIGYYEIHAGLPEREMRFYKEVFGWKFIREEAIPFPYYRIENAGILGALLQRPAGKPALGLSSNAFVCSIQVENFESTASKIVNAGGSLFIPKFAIPARCWQGYFLDTDENMIGIFEVDDKAGL